MKDKRRLIRPSFCFIGISVQHPVVSRRHLPDDCGCSRSFYDPSSEYLCFFGFEPECQCRNHFEAILFDNVAVSAARAADNAVFMQNSAFEYCSDIRAYSSSEYTEQVGDLALRKPYSVGGRANRYLPVFDCYGLCRHSWFLIIGYSCFAVLRRVRAFGLRTVSAAASYPRPPFGPLHGHKFGWSSAVGVPSCG